MQLIDVYTIMRCGMSLIRCQWTVSKSSIAKWCCKISMFLTKNSPDLYALTLCIMFRKK